MTNSQAALPIDIEALNSFWYECFQRIEVHSDSALFGEQDNTGLIPPAFQYSDGRAVANERAKAVLAGKVDSIDTPERDFTDQGVGIPAIGDMSILCDGEGKPAALLCDTAVEVVPKHGEPTVVETFEVLYP